MAILVTGGAGYIGSHACVELIQAGYEVIVVDNLINSNEEALKRVQEIAVKKLKFYKVDLIDKKELEEVFRDNVIDAVIHFAGLKAVGESVSIPLKYYSNNIISTLTLCEVMQNFNVKNLVFSSSATVYGDPISVPITEAFPLNTTNPYGRTKLMIEEILRDLYKADNNLNIAILRYFNPVGAHKSGLIGEDPNGIPNNLVPYITQVAVGKLKKLNVYGNDYNTPDGTGVRDYIHVVDLALGHLRALERLKTNPGLVTYNLGTGRGYSVLEMVEAFREVSGHEIPYEIVDRRPGDIATCFADTTLVQNELGFYTQRDVLEMCEDSWRWQVNNPNGYKKMIKPTLLVMAAGIGSRYGGLKQLDSVGPNGEMIIDYSIYDAIKAGFGKVVFIIKEERKEDFQEKIGAKIEKLVEVQYVFQKLEDIPEGFTVPEGRIKPWGTAQAVLCCRDVINTPFAVINADDFYGYSTFKGIHDYLTSAKDSVGFYDYSMVGFKIENTLTDNGHVARGVCAVNNEGYLKEIHERTHIKKIGDVVKYIEDNDTWIEIQSESIVSMNIWGFTPSIFSELEARFPEFLNTIKDNPLKAEYFLPSVVDNLIGKGKAKVKVLKSKEQWYGVTYKEDKPLMRKAIRILIENGVYPENLWGDNND